MTGQLYSFILFFEPSTITLLQVQHVGVLMQDTLYISCNCYVGMPTACGHACTRYAVYISKLVT